MEEGFATVEWAGRAGRPASCRIGPDERARPANPLAKLAVVTVEGRIAIPCEETGGPAEGSGNGRWREARKRALHEGARIVFLSTADMEPNEQAQRLEVMLVGGHRTRRVLECRVAGADSIVAEREDVERVGILAHVTQKLVQMADRAAVVLEPERMHGLALQPRAVREPAGDRQSAHVSFVSPGDAG